MALICVFMGMIFMQKREENDESDTRLRKVCTGSWGNSEICQRSILQAYFTCKITPLGERLHKDLAVIPSLGTSCPTWPIEIFSLRRQMHI